MRGERSDALLVMGKHSHALARGQVPKTHSRVHRSSNDLGVRLLRNDGRHSALVAGKDHDVCPRAHVPDPSYTVSARRDEHVEGGVQRERVDAGEVAVVVANHAVAFEVPTLDHFVLAAGEEIWMARGYG